MHPTEILEYIPNTLENHKLIEKMHIPAVSMCGREKNDTSVVIAIRGFFSITVISIAAIESNSRYEMKEMMIKNGKFIPAVKIRKRKHGQIKQRN